MGTVTERKIVYFAYTPSDFIIYFLVSMLLTIGAKNVNKDEEKKGIPTTLYSSDAQIGILWNQN